MKVNLKNLSISIPILFSGIALFLHGYLGYFSRYIGDDFCSVVRAQRLGVLRAAWSWYLDWSGRYSASVLDGMVGLLGPNAVPVIVPFTLVIWLTVLTTFFLIFLNQLKNSFFVSLALATTSLFTLFLLTPDVRQSLYWGQGMHSVVPPLIMGTIQIILLNQIRLRAWTKIQLVFWGILNFFWALVAGGFSETYALFQAAALFFSLVVILVAEKFKFTNTALFLASGFLGAVSALIIVILAPGNLERQSFFPPAPGVIGILTISLKGFLVYTIGLANSAGKIMAILGLFGLAAIAGARLPREMNSRLLIVIPGLTVGFTFLCFPPAAYGLSDAPPGRTLILPTYFFLIGLLALGTVCGNLLTKKQNFIVSKMLPSLVMVTVILAASIHSINLYRSRSEFIEFAARWDEMDAQIVKSKQNGAAEIFIPVIQNWASINTPNDNPKFWVNICMSSYYGVQVFATPDPSAPAP